MNVDHQRKTIRHSVSNPIMAIVVAEVMRTMQDMPEMPKVHGELLIGEDEKMSMSIECVGTDASMALIMYHILDRHPSARELVEGLLNFGGGNKEEVEDIPSDADLDEVRKTFFGASK